MIIRRLTPDDLKEYRRLRLESLQESPSAFGSSYAEELKRPLSDFRERLKGRDESWVLGAFAKGVLVGMARFERDGGEKERHKASIFGMYVTPEFRRRGIARRLLHEILEEAKQQSGLRQVRLSVVASNDAALTLYKAVGFKEYGIEEAALFVDGEFYSEILMVRFLL